MATAKSTSPLTTINLLPSIDCDVADTKRLVSLRGGIRYSITTGGLAELLWHSVRNLDYRTITSYIGCRMLRRKMAMSKVMKSMKAPVRQ